jgi:hypothetical protein
LSAHSVIFLSRRWTIHGRGRCFSNGATDWRKLRCGKQIYESFQSVRHPFILTPGDNDWTDCHLVKDPKIDPLDRLAKVRALFFPEGRSLGQRTMPAQSQATDSQYAKFRENLRWSINGITFATLHIVGSNDNFGRTPEMDGTSRTQSCKPSLVACNFRGSQG